MLTCGTSNKVKNIILTFLFIKISFYCLADSTLSPRSSAHVILDEQIAAFLQNPNPSVDLFLHELGDKIVAQSDEEYFFAKAIIFSKLTDRQKADFGRALIEMSKKAVGHQMTLCYYAAEILQHRIGEELEIYASVRESQNGMDVLSLQMVKYRSQDTLKQFPSLSLWVSTAETKLTAHQILAFTLNDLLKQGVTRVDTGRVNYSQVKSSLFGKDHLTAKEMLEFLNHNAIRLIQRLKNDPKAFAVLKTIIQNNHADLISRTSGQGIISESA